MSVQTSRSAYTIGVAVASSQQVSRERQLREVAESCNSEDLMVSKKNLELLATAVAILGPNL
jgi:hypothetical protein